MDQISIETFPQAFLDKKFIIYGLVDPRNGQLKYVGQTRHGVVRIQQHLQAPRLKVRTRKNMWIRGLLNKGLLPIPVVLESYDSEEALNGAEKRAIQRYRTLGCKLTNMTVGGDYFKRVVKPETCKKISEARKKEWQDPEYRKRAMEARKNGHSPEVRKKISEKRIKRTPIKATRVSDGKEFTFSSPYEAGVMMGFDRDKVFRCCRGKYKTHKGFRFEFVGGENAIAN